MGKYTHIARRIKPAPAEKAEPSVTDELTPIITLDEINKIVDAFDAKFLGVKPKGWLPEHDV